MHMSTHINIGIVHSLIGKNDGVSIVIDQSVNAMVNNMGVDLGSIFFLAAHTSPRFNATTNYVLWHKNKVHKAILMNYSTTPLDDLDKMIHENAMVAKDVIKDFVNKNNIDLLIAHNTSHVYNFITAVGLGYYIEELRSNGIVWPKVIVWWHDSFLERKEFENPNSVIKKYLKYLPGTNIDGVVVINSRQEYLAKQLYKNLNFKYFDTFFKERCVVIPNTSKIDWDWKNQNWDGDEYIYPEQDRYNETFFKDIGLLDELEKHGTSISDSIFLLQHTRIIPRKKIETAIDYAFRLEKKFSNSNKTIILLVSGHSGDEQNEYKQFLKDYFADKKLKHKEANVIMVFGEDYILSNRDIIVDRKFYQFSEIPSIIAAYGGLGTYFSEVEGFGNNLLEMASLGLPVVINKYEIYKSDIEHLGFKFPATEDGTVTDELVEEGYKLLTDVEYRNGVVKNNLDVIGKKLGHDLIAKKLSPLIENCFKKLMGANNG